METNPQKDREGNKEIQGLKDCLYCDGFTTQCNYYIPQENELCFWYSYLERHLGDFIENEKYKIHQG